MEYPRKILCSKCKGFVECVAVCEGFKKSGDALYSGTCLMWSTVYGT